MYTCFCCYWDEFVHVLWIDINYWNHFVFLVMFLLLETMACWVWRDGEVPWGVSEWWMGRLKRYRVMELGPWFNIKLSFYQYRKSHCGDKTVVRSSYLQNGISCTGKMTSLYWITSQVTIGSGNGLVPFQYQAIIWTNSDLLLTWHLIAKFSLNQNLIFFHSRKSLKCRLKGAGHFDQASICQNFQDQTKRPTFWRWFQVHFIDIKCLFWQRLAGICSCWSGWTSHHWCK